MMLKLIRLLVFAMIILLSSGCASYRTSSNINSENSTSLAPNSRVIITEGMLSGRKYREIGPIEVTVKKLTVFHKSPTAEQANEALKEKAREIGADAVIEVTYDSGVGFTSWGYIEAKGTGVKLLK